MQNKFSLLLLFAFFALGFVRTDGQSQCDCEITGVCSTAQTCSSGYNAVCNCTSGSCSSHCQRASGDEPAPEGLTRGVIESLKSGSGSEIGKVLSKALGRQIRFTAPDENFTLTQFPFSYKTSPWDVVEHLSRNGKITINGLNFEVWQNKRKGLLDGSDFTICVGDAPVDVVIQYLEFLSGQRLQVINGDRMAILSKPISGKGLTDLLSKLDSASGVIVVPY